MFWKDSRHQLGRHIQIKRFRLRASIELGLSLNAGWGQEGEEEYDAQGRPKH